MCVHTRVCVCVCVLQEDDYEWGSSSILDALPSIPSQQRRLATAAMRWRKTLQDTDGKEVHTLLVHTCKTCTHI